jgi:hypothetical protein
MSVFQITDTKNILETCHFGQRNIGTDPRKFPLIFDFLNFDEFQKILISPEMHHLDAIFCFMQLKQHWNKIIIYKYTIKGNFRRGIFWRY